MFDDVLESFHNGSRENSGSGRCFLKNIRNFFGKMFFEKSTSPNPSAKTFYVKMPVIDN